MAATSDLERAANEPVDLSFDETGIKRELTGYAAKLVAFVALAFSTYQLVIAGFSPLSSLPTRSIHVGFLLALSFLIHPIAKFVDRRRIAYTTVMNTMARLAKKHLLRVEKRDQAYIYYPNVTQQEFVSRFVGRILEDLFINFSGATLENLDALPDQKAAAQARKTLDEIARRRAVEEKE